MTFFNSPDIAPLPLLAPTWTNIRWTASYQSQGNTFNRNYATFCNPLTTVDVISTSLVQYGSISNERFWGWTKPNREVHLR